MNSPCEHSPIDRVNQNSIWYYVSNTRLENEKAWHTQSAKSDRVLKRERRVLSAEQHSDRGLYVSVEDERGSLILVYISPLFSRWLESSYSLSQHGSRIQDVPGHDYPK